MKRPNGDWRLRPLERDRWRRLPRDERGDCLGSAVRACPGAVVDMVEPMVGSGFRAFFLRSRAAAVFAYSLRRGRTLPRARSGVERLYVRNGSTTCAVLQLCAVCWCATVAKERRLAGRPPEGRFSARRASSAQLFWLVRAARDLEKLCHKSHVNTSSITRLIGRRLVFPTLKLLNKFAQILKKRVQMRSPKASKSASRSPKSGALAPVAYRKAHSRALREAFRPILPPVEARAGNKQLKIGLLKTGRLEIGRLWKGLIGDWRCLSMPGGLLPLRLRCWNLS